MKLVLGVLDMAYVEDGHSTTTGDVAGFLEDRYHVMRSFVELHEGEIGTALADGIAGNIESLAMGVPLSRITMQGATAKIEEEFKDFLDRDEMGQLLPATWQSKAAAAGVSHRKKDPDAEDNAARPSFVDTGLYRASFRAWLTNVDTE